MQGAKPQNVTSTNAAKGQAIPPRKMCNILLDLLVPKDVQGLHSASSLPKEIIDAIRGKLHIQPTHAVTESQAESKKKI